VVDITEEECSIDEGGEEVKLVVVTPAVELTPEDDAVVEGEVEVEVVASEVVWGTFVLVDGEGRSVLVEVSGDVEP
jgi:hypothetical protein